MNICSDSVPAHWHTKTIEVLETMEVLEILEVAEIAFEHIQDLQKQVKTNKTVKLQNDSKTSYCSSKTINRLGCGVRFAEYHDPRECPRPRPPRISNVISRRGHWPVGTTGDIRGCLSNFCPTGTNRRPVVDLDDWHHAY